MKTHNETTFFKNYTTKNNSDIGEFVSVIESFRYEESLPRIRVNGNFKGVKLLG